MTAAGAMWRNWGRTESVRPVRVERPADEGAVQRAVTAAAASGMLVKAVGAGHSFTGIAVAPGVQLDLDDLSGIVSVDRERARVTFRAGTRLHRLTGLLEPLGLALENLGDIDRQSIAGAISTGTHGTGARFGGIASRVVGVRIVSGDGGIVTVSDDDRPELLPAVRVGLGALGVLVEVTLQCVPAFVVRAEERREAVRDVVDAFEERVDAADHFEFYWFPHTETALTKTNTRMPAGTRRTPRPRIRRLIDEEVLSNEAFRGVCALGRVAPAVVPRLNRVASALSGERDFTDHSASVFASSRRVRFREMEYAIPREHLAEAFGSLRRVIDESGWRITFPVEVRAAAADDDWLSTAYGRPTAYIAVHRYFRENHSEYFRAVEEIMREYGGRPHWGKLHTQDSEGLRRLYPRFDDFARVRDEFDPRRTFTNPYLQRVLGS